MIFKDFGKTMVLNGCSFSAVGDIETIFSGITNLSPLNFPICLYNVFPIINVSSTKYNRL